MRIELEIPKWAEGRNIRIFAGVEALANYCASKKTLYIKTKRCNLCGKCCIVDETFLNWNLPTKYGDAVGWDEDLEICKYLEKEVWNFDEYKNQTVYICTAPSTVKPWACLIGFICGDESWREYKPYCVIEYEKVE